MHYPWYPQSPVKHTGLAVNALLMLSCLSAMEYLEPLPPGEPLSGLHLHLAALLYQYQAAIK